MQAWRPFHCCALCSGWQQLAPKLACSRLQGAAAGGSNPAGAQLLFSFFPDGASVSAANQTIGYRLLRWAGFFRHAGVPRWCGGGSSSCCHRNMNAACSALLWQSSTCLPACLPALFQGCSRHSPLAQSPRFSMCQQLPNMQLLKSLPARRPAILKAGGLFTQELQVRGKLGGRCRGQGGKACKDAVRQQAASACALGGVCTGQRARA